MRPTVGTMTDNSGSADPHRPISRDVVDADFRCGGTRVRMCCAIFDVRAGPPPGASLGTLGGPSAALLSRARPQLFDRRLVDAQVRVAATAGLGACILVDADETSATRLSVIADVERYMCCAGFTLNA